MHELSIPADLVDRVTTRTGRAHPFDVIEPAKTAFVVVDMQNYFMKPGFQGVVPMARAIVPAVNRLAGAVRQHIAADNEDRRRQCGRPACARQSPNRHRRSPLR